MSRHERRRMAKEMGSRPTRAEVVAMLTMAMAQDGPLIRKQLEDAVGGLVKPGHMIDAQMTAAAEMVAALRAGNPSDACDAVVRVLWLARAIAYSQGKITDEPSADETSN